MDIGCCIWRHQLITIATVRRIISSRKTTERNISVIKERRLRQWTVQQSKVTVTCPFHFCAFIQCDVGDADFDSIQSIFVATKQEYLPSVMIFSTPSTMRCFPTITTSVLLTAQWTLADFGITTPKIIQVFILVIENLGKRSSASEGDIFQEKLCLFFPKSDKTLR